MGPRLKARRQHSEDPSVRRWRTAKLIVYGVLTVVITGLLWYFYLVVQPAREATERKSAIPPPLPAESGRP
jgi:hypothetical protein